jgi:succinyl-diaminopimelate desuccinylase
VEPLADRLATRTRELVDIPSESRNEAAIREHVRAAVTAPFAEVYAGDEVFLWARERRPNAPLLVLAGHYDTVPPQDNIPGRRENGWVVGCGASDM